MSNKSYQEFKDAVNIIKSRGIVKTNVLNSNTIYKYNFDKGKFEKYDKNKLYNLFKRLYLNSYDVVYPISSIIAELIPIDFNQVDNYYKYRDVKDKTFDFSEFENRLKEFSDLNNLNKKEVKSVYWKPISQLQHLINNDVLSDGKLLCKWNYLNKRFDIIYPKEVIRFFKNVNFKENISPLDVETNYGFFVNNLTNIGSLLDDFTNYSNSIAILNNCKNDYEVINNLVQSFD